MIKPFVFLDLVDTQDALGQQGYGWHPHSGIATLTLLMDGQCHYAESTDHEGTMEAGDIEWMSAGRGVWHTGFVVPRSRPSSCGSRCRRSANWLPPSATIFPSTKSRPTARRACCLDAAAQVVNPKSHADRN
jgi:redox-sensitive bicupin YhaK (pirin superfamily)